MHQYKFECYVHTKHFLNKYFFVLQIDPFSHKIRFLFNMNSEKSQYCGISRKKVRIVCNKLAILVKIDCEIL